MLALALSLLLAPSSHDPAARLAELERRIAAAPHDVSLYLQRARALAALGRHREAGADYRRVLTARPGDVEAALGLARTRIRIGDAAAARDLLAGIEARVPTARMAAELARAAALAGDGDLAERAAARALSRAAGIPDPDLVLAHADALAARDPAAAIAALDAAEARVGPLVVLRERAAALAEHAGDFAGAARRVAAIAASADRPESWLLWQARLLDRAGCRDEAARARALARAALRRLPDHRLRTPAARRLAHALAGVAAAEPAAAPAPPAPVSVRLRDPPVREAPASAGRPLVAAGCKWRYLDDGSDQGVAWRAPAFNDSSWAAGAAQLGYGDGDEKTAISYGGNPANKHITYWFRHAFTVSDPTALAVARLDLLRDDGARVFLNGSEIVRDNLPAGIVGHLTPASVGVTGDDEDAFFSFPVDPALLVAGRNVLAVEVHQVAPTSSDVGFDLALDAATSIAVTRGPYLQSVTTTAAVIRWRTDFPTPSAVWLGDRPGNLTLRAFSPVATREHAVAVSGLSPRTRYHYAVGDGRLRLRGDDADHWLRTAPGPGPAPLRVWVIGDSGTANADARRVRDAYLGYARSTRPADIWLMLGDNAYDRGTDAEYQAAVFDTYPTLLRNTCLWPTFGNHDAGSSTSHTQIGVYYDVFTLPRQGEAGGLPSGTEAYYSFDQGDVHFVCMDSQDSDRSPTGAMASWLRADLANNTRRWVVAYFHHPPYSKGSHDSDNPLDSEGRLFEMRMNLLPILEQHGADLVLCGHSHSYERSFLLDGHYGTSSTLVPAMRVDRGDGRVEGDGAYYKPDVVGAAHAGALYAVAGSSGRVTAAPLDHPAMVVSLAVFGSMVLDFGGDRLDARFLDDGGVVRDAFTLRKDAPPPLRRDEPGVSVSAGGVQNLSLDLGPAHAGRSYLVVGSLGTSPGLQLGSVHVPLNLDAFLQLTLALANGPLYRSTLGVLDGSGRAQCALRFPPSSNGRLVGASVWHAAVVFDSTPRAATNAVRLRFEP